MKAKEIVRVLESFSPLSWQHSYDNSGWMIGAPDEEVKGILVALDLSAEVLEEAVQTGSNLVIIHHPLLFRPIKRIMHGDNVSDMIAMALRNNIMVYAAHTNLDTAREGVNGELARRLGLENFNVLKPLDGTLNKLVVFVPFEHAPKVRSAMFNAGAGNIGEYDSCSFNLEGKGSFRAGEQANPFAGKKEELHFEPEYRVETIVHKHLIGQVVKAMKEAHPYEEVAYDVYPLDNSYEGAGYGGVGQLKNPLAPKVFLGFVKDVLGTGAIKYGGHIPQKIKNVAICGGSGQALIGQAVKNNAQAFITGDLKYHDFVDARNKIMLVDAGHYETEQFTKDLIKSILNKKFPKFAIPISQVDVNPVKYF